MDKIWENISEIIRADKIEAPDGFQENVDVYSIRYRSDECEVEGFAAFPKEQKEKLPVLIYNRGGNLEFGVLKPETLCEYALYGYAVLGSQYRGNCGGTGREEFGGREINDVLHLTDIALKLPFVRTEGIYMVGHSRGGMMTYQACAIDSRIKAAGIHAGLADSFIMYKREQDSMLPEYHGLVGGSPEELPEAFIHRSATCWAEKIKPPIIICQGTDDWRVIPEQSYKMDMELTRAGKEHILKIYKGADHSLKGTSAVEDIMDWFEKHPL